jgi:hypothetical protein
MSSKTSCSRNLTVFQFSRSANSLVLKSLEDNTNTVTNTVTVTQYCMTNIFFQSSDILLLLLQRLIGDTKRGAEQKLLVLLISYGTNTSV